ncbi:MAG TPA: VTT domain-containing protein [Terriglobales bacterium]|nr:VTT domain-containing protein [Terriglobales bacterium]
MSWQPLASLLWQAARRTSRPTGWQATLRHLGGFGLFALAILDGSPIPTLGGLDLLTVVLAARHREPWYYYALIATAGGLIGSFITYSIARKAGEAYLTRKLGESGVHRLLGFVRQWGGGGLAVATLFPPPFPATVVFAAAGILCYPARRYLGAVAAGRALRYGLLAWAAARYGRHFVLLVRHPERYLGWSILIGGLVIAMVAAGLFTWRWMREAAPLEQQRSGS